MFDLEKYIAHTFSAGRGVVLMPSLGIFKVDGLLEQGDVTFAHTSSISGLESVLNTIEQLEIQQNDITNETLLELKGRSIRETITTFTGIKKSIFRESDLAIFSFDTKLFHSFEDHDKDMEFLKLLSDKVFHALNVIRFIHCDLFITDKLPYIPGYWEHSDNFMGACICCPGQIPEIIAGQQMGGMVSSGLGIGLESTDTIGMEGHPFVTSIAPDEPSRGEVGVMIEHALKLYNRAMYVNSETLKFINIMALFEYLGTGNKYTNFKQVRPKLQSHIAQNKEQYEKLSAIFQKLTSLKIEGINIGYRTRIIHEGALIEEILTSRTNREDLFHNLTEYVQCIIHGMYPHANKSLDELQDHRQSILRAIGVST